MRSPMLLVKAHPLKNVLNTPTKNMGPSRSTLRRTLSLVNGKGLPLLDMPKGPQQIQPSQLPYEMFRSLNSKNIWNSLQHVEESVLKCALKGIYSSISLPSNGKWLMQIIPTTRSPARHIDIKRCWCQGTTRKLPPPPSHGANQNYQWNRTMLQPFLQYLSLCGIC